MENSFGKFLADKNGKKRSSNGASRPTLLTRANSFGKFLWEIPLENSFGKFLWKVFGGQKWQKKVCQRSLSADPIDKGEIPLGNSFGKFLAEKKGKKRSVDGAFRPTLLTREDEARGGRRRREEEEEEQS